MKLPGATPSLGRGAIATGTLLAACYFDPPHPPADLAGQVVLIGDSITQLGKNGEPEAGFLIVSPTLDEPLPGAVDVGIPSQATSQMLARSQTDVLALHPSVVLILGSTNDLHELALPAGPSAAA
jgi:hypothetical protein